MSGRKSGAPRASYLPLLVAFALTLVLRLLVAHGVASSPLLARPQLDDAQALEAAQRIEDTGGLGSELTMGSPLYALWLAALPGKASGLPRVAPTVQAIVEAMSALLLAYWVARRFGSKAALLAGVLFAADPIGGIFAARLIPTALTTLAFLGTLVAADHLTDRATTATRLLQGLLLAIGVLLAPLPFLALLVLLARRAWRSPADRTTALAFLVAPVVVLAGLFLARNAASPDSGPALSWGSGVSLSRAFDPATGGTPRFLRPPSVLDPSTLRSMVWEAIGKEGQSDDLLRFYWVRGFQQLVENPVATLGTFLTKAVGTLGAVPIPDALSPGFLLSRQLPLLGWARFDFAAYLALGLAAWVALRRRPEAAPFTLGLAAIGIACLLGPTSAAARQPAVALLAGLVGAGFLGARDQSARDHATFSIGRALPIAAGLLALSLACGLLGPSAKLQNPSEDLRLLAGATAQQGSAKEIQSLLGESLRANPANLESRTALASAYQRDQLNDRAQEELDKAYATDSTHVATLFYLSRLAQARGENARAAEYMAKIVNQRPGNPLYLNELGQLLAQLGRMGDARRFFVQALTLKPDYAVARTNLEAIESYERQMEDSLYPPEMRLAPGDPLDAATPVIVMAMEQKDWQKADSLITWAETTRPEIVLPHWLRAGYFGRRGDVAQSIAALERCQQLAPGRPTVVQLLASLYLQTGNRSAAERLVESSIAAAESDPARVQALTAIRAQLLENKSK
ncbi:MAG: tetratricopeptide repeat protein [Candidatus Eisenbacteria bacterium]